MRKEPRRKSEAYETLHALNQHFEQVLRDLDRLQALGLRADLLRHFHVVVEESRAWSNFEVTEVLHETELKDWTRYGRLRRKQIDDIFRSGDEEKPKEVEC